MQLQVVSLALIAVTLTGLAAAQGGAVSGSPGPGMVTPDSPLYGLEVAWDNAAVMIGLKTAGAVVEERAAEAVAMQQKNNTVATERAVSELTRATEQADSIDDESINTATSHLQNMMARMPPGGGVDGVQNAIDRMETVESPASNPDDDPIPTEPENTTPRPAMPEPPTPEN